VDTPYLSLTNLTAKSSDWWPSKLGGVISYTFFWSSSLAFGALAHYYDLFGIGQRRRSKEGDGDDLDWERKSEWHRSLSRKVGAKRSHPAFWILLTFVTMMAPALVCFSKLKRERRHLYRHSLTDLQKA
jgi:hypothetical protein